MVAVVSTVVSSIAELRVDLKCQLKTMLCHRMYHHIVRSIDHCLQVLLAHPNPIQSNPIQSLFRGYYTAVFISTRISRSSVDYQPEAKAEG